MNILDNGSKVLDVFFLQANGDTWHVTSEDFVSDRLSCIPL